MKTKYETWFVDSLLILFVGLVVTLLSLAFTDEDALHLILEVFSLW